MALGNKSPSAAITSAIERARALLFPVRLEKWLALGFIAFLAGLAEGNGPHSYSFPFPGSSGGGKGTSSQKRWSEALAWIQENAVLVVMGASAALVLGAALGILLCWLSSRGKLMFVESLIHDRYQVKEPWARLREPAWEVFKFRLILGFLFLLGLVLALGVGGFLALDDLKTGDFGNKSVVAGLASLAILALFITPLSLISVLFDDFAIPLIYLRGGNLSGAWVAVRREVLAINAGSVALFYLLKILLGAAFAVVTILAACLTCCVAALPYVSSVVLLPAHAFFRCYSLYFLEELGLPIFPEPPAAGAFPNDPGRLTA